MRLSAELVARLEDLAELGIHGTTYTEAAENLVREQIVHLIETDFFERAQKTRGLRQRPQGGKGVQQRKAPKTRSG
jgi:hypothetical protein